MSKTKQKYYKYLGQKFFKQEDEEHVKLIRIIKILPFNDKVVIKDEFTNNITTVTMEKLRGYTPLDPVALVTVASVKMPNSGRDVIVSLYRLLDLKVNIKVPYCICRQNALDFFYTLISKDPENDQLVGISCNRDDCPTNIKYEDLMSCSGLINNTAINLYYNDVIDNIIECLDVEHYNKILMSTFRKHADYINNPFIVDDKNIKSHGGWCKTLKQLLVENNFQNDIDNLFNILAIDTNLEENCHMGDDDVLHFNPDLRNYFCYIEKLSAVDVVAIPYWHDVDLSEFNNKNYIFVRDINNKLYICCYRMEGEYLEKDLLDEMNKLSTLEKYALHKYDKWIKEKV